MVSVLMTVYNTESYLRRSIESVINQTYRDLEIVIVDDGSTDQSSAICDEYAAKDKRIRVIHKANGGIHAARNECIRQAKGDYLCWIDGDDKMHPDMIEKMLKCLIEYDADLCACRYAQVFSDHTVDASTDKVIVFDRIGCMEQFLKEDEAVLIQNAVWNKLYKRSVAEGIMFPELWYEDMVYTLKLLERSAKTVYLDTALYDYTRDREDSATNRGINPKTYTDLIPNFMDRSRFLREKGLDEAALISDYMLIKKLLVFITDVFRSSDPEKKEHLQILDGYIRNSGFDVDRIYSHPFAKKNEQKKLRIYLSSPLLYHITMRLNDSFIIPLKVRLHKRKISNV